MASCIAAVGYASTTPGASAARSAAASSAGAGAVDGAASHASASSAMVGQRKIRSMVTGRPVALAATPSRMATMESPPSAKKLSCTPGSSMPSTCAHTAARARSVAVRGPTRDGSGAATAVGGAGRRARSSLPLVVSGSAGTSTRAAGTMCAGRCSSSAVRTSAGRSTAPDDGTRYPTMRGRPGVSSRSMQAAARTPGWSSSARSISPSSIRKPFSFTWSSARPRYSSSPSGVRTARSPERYSRSPGAPNGSRTNRSAVSSGRLR